MNNQQLWCVMSIAKERTELLGEQTRNADWKENGNYDKVFDSFLEMNGRKIQGVKGISYSLVSTSQTFMSCVLCVLGVLFLSIIDEASFLPALSVFVLTWSYYVSSEFKADMDVIEAHQPVNIIINYFLCIFLSILLRLLSDYTFIPQLVSSAVVIAFAMSPIILSSVV